MTNRRLPGSRRGNDRVGSDDPATTKVVFFLTWCKSETNVDPECSRTDCLSRTAGMSFVRKLSDTPSALTGKQSRFDQLLDFLMVVFFALEKPLFILFGSFDLERLSISRR